jgi:hypothetical protein
VQPLAQKSQGVIVVLTVIAPYRLFDVIGDFEFCGIARQATRAIGYHQIRTREGIQDNILIREQVVYCVSKPPSSAKARVSQLRALKADNLST